MTVVIINADNKFACMYSYKRKGDVVLNIEVNTPNSANCVLN